MTAALSDTVSASMLDRFTAIIDAFGDAAGGLTLDQIAGRTGLPRSTTHRILDQLVRLRWLTHAGRGYRLGRSAAPDGQRGRTEGAAACRSGRGSELGGGALRRALRGSMGRAGSTDGMSSMCVPNARARTST